LLCLQVSETAPILRRCAAHAGAWAVTALRHGSRRLMRSGGGFETPQRLGHIRVLINVLVCYLIYLSEMCYVCRCLSRLPSAAAAPHTPAPALKQPCVMAAAV